MPPPTQSHRHAARPYPLYGRAMLPAPIRSMAAASPRGTALAGRRSRASLLSLSTSCIRSVPLLSLAILSPFAPTSPPPAASSCLHSAPSAPLTRHARCRATRVARVAPRTQEEGLRLSGDGTLDFGSCYAGVPTRSLLTVRNTSAAALDVHFSSDEPSEVTRTPPLPCCGPSPSPSLPSEV